MKHLTITSDIWKTSKESHNYMASKHFKLVENFVKKLMSITIQVDSIKELQKLMRAIDQGQTLATLIQTYDIGHTVKALTLQSDGKIIIKKADKTIEIHNFNELNQAIKQLQPANLNKDQVNLTLFRHLLSTSLLKNSEQPATISIETIYDKATKPKETLIVREKSTWLSEYSERFFLKFFKVTQYFKDFLRPRPKIIELPNPQEFTGKRGIDILDESFISSGEVSPDLQKNWIQKIMPPWLHTYVLSNYIPAISYTEQDKQEMTARERASKLNLTRKNRKTLTEKRLDFEAIFSTKYPDKVFKHMTITTADGANLDTFAIVNKASKELLAPQQKWIVFFHSADAAYENSLPTLCQIVKDTGANLYTGNYRGVGNSNGMPFQAKDLILDGETMIEHLLQSGVLPENILVHGFSMGGGIGTEVVSLHPGMHLCNDRSFTKLSDCLNLIVPPKLKFFSNKITSTLWEFNSIDNLENITGNVLVISSVIESTIVGKAKLALWVSRCTGYLERKVIWLTERYLEEPDKEIRASRAHSDPITKSKKYTEYLDFVRNALKIKSHH